MGQITIQGHRGQRTIEVKSKRRFANLGKVNDGQVAVVANEKPPIIKATPAPTETCQHVEIQRAVDDFESGLMASISQFNENKPRRKHPRDRDDYQDNYHDNGKQAYRRDKSWRK